MRFLSILSIFASLVSCNTDYSNYHFTKVEYHFHDGSVSPHHHRSYIINTEQDHLHLEVSDYEGVRLDTIFPLSKENFKRLVQLSYSQDEKGVSLGLNKNGGSTEELYFYDCNGLVSDYIWSEGNSSSFSSIIDCLKGLIPDFDNTLHIKNRTNGQQKTTVAAHQH